jgi:hypothetical protein
MMMNSEGTQFDIPVVSSVNALHTAIREALERDCEGAWRVQRITEYGSTNYAATKDSRTQSSPEYIYTSTNVSFDVDLIENAALDRIIDDKPVAVPLPRLHVKLVLLSTGKLMIVHSDIASLRTSGPPFGSI